MSCSSALKINFITLFSRDIAKILQTCYFGQAWPCPPRLMVSTCRIVWCLSICKKSTSKCKIPYFRVLFIQIWPKINFLEKIGLHHFLAYIVPYLHAKKLRANFEKKSKLKFEQTKKHSSNYKTYPVKPVDTKFRQFWKHVQNGRTGKAYYNSNENWRANKERKK